MKTSLFISTLLIVFSSLNAETDMQFIDQKLRQQFSVHQITPLKNNKRYDSRLFQLGEKLFAEKELAGNRNISCKTCHSPDFGSSDGLPLPIGEGGIGEGTARQLGTGAIIPRHSPSLFNLGSANVMFWDGRVSFNPAKREFQTPEAGLNGPNPEFKEMTSVLNSALAAQALFPPTSHEEMRGAVGTNEIADAQSNREVWGLLMKRLLQKNEYQQLFFSAFPHISLEEQNEKLNMAHAAVALAEFQRIAFETREAPIDRYLAGDSNALTESQKRGAMFFLTTGKCAQCHGGPRFTDDSFHAIGFPQIGPGKDSEGDDLGRMLVDGLETSRYAFKTPGLRGLKHSAPWGHSGAFWNIRDIILHYFHPMRTFRHYEPRHVNIPYQLEHETLKQQDRWNAMDARVKEGFALNNQQLLELEDFLLNAL